jgi:putative SOS response-associated peptidase YedK
VCNDFGNRVPYDEYLRAFSQIKAPIRFPTTAPNLEPREDIWPTDPASVIRRCDDGVELLQMRWGFPAARPKAGPVINFRSEGRRFPVGRCLVPASHFYEFTGTKSPKTKWKFTKAGEDWFCFAGLWRPMLDGSGADSGASRPLIPG